MIAAGSMRSMRAREGPGRPGAATPLAPPLSPLDLHLLPAQPDLTPLPLRDAVNHPADFASPPTASLADRPVLVELLPGVASLAQVHLALGRLVLLVLSAASAAETCREGQLHRPQGHRYCSQSAPPRSVPGARERERALRAFAHPRSAPTGIKRLVLLSSSAPA